MDATRRYFVRIAGELRGPLAVEHLRDLAEAEAIKPDSLVAENRDGPWAPLETLPILAEVYPARRVLNFTNKAFEKVADLNAPTLDPDHAIEQANRPPASFRGREIEVNPHGVRGTPTDAPPNEVQEMVLEVGRRVAAHEPPKLLAPPPARFPQWRWFLALAVIGSAAILCIPMLYEWRYDGMSVAILLMWVAGYNGLLAFVMVLDRKHSEGFRTRRLKPDASE